MITTRNSLGPIIDTHLHIIGDGVDPAFTPDRTYDPPFAPVDQIIALHDTLGITNAVLVQVSVYGPDNRLMETTLRSYPDRFRGIAVVDSKANDKTLNRLRDAGVVGLRQNMMHGGGPSIADLAQYAAICRDFGFHLQVYLDGTLLLELAPLFGKLQIPVVFDHFGGIGPNQAFPGHPVIETMASLLADGAWVKLSAPYRISDQASGFNDTIALGRRLLKAAPNRCLWGSDWPHVATDKLVPSDALLDLAIEIADTNCRTDLLWTNAQTLYGF